VAAQLAVLESTVVNVQGLPVKAPVPEVVKLTVPVGVVGLPEVSVTVAVQLVLTPANTLFGEQLTVVVVGFLLKVTVTDWLAFPMLKLQELPEQPVIPELCRLHPAKVFPELAVAASIPTSLLPVATVHVVVQVVLLPGAVVSDTAT